MLKITCVLLFFGCVYGGTFYDSNLYMDEVIRKFPSGTTIYFRNFSTSDFDSLGVNVNMNYYNCVVTGMFRVQRNGNCSPTYRVYGNITLNCSLFLENVKIKCDLKLKYGNQPFTIVKAEGTMTPSYIDAQFTTNATLNRPFLKRIYLTQRGSFKSYFSGPMQLSPSLQAIVNVHLSNVFSTVYDYNFVPTLGSAAAHTNMPLS